MNNNPSFLGTGWSFPPTFSKDIPGVELAVDVRDVQESIRILLSTDAGQRLMHYQFGCDLNRLLFQPVDASLQTYASDFIKSALLRYEPRIKVEQVALAPSDAPNCIHISVDYLIKKTNSRQNLVYPFYLQEGTDIES